jgi:hypothetical protein
MPKFAVAAVLILSALPLSAGHIGARAEFIGGTCADIPANQSGDMRMADSIYFVFLAKKTQIKIPYERINLLEYGQDVSHRYIQGLLISRMLFTAKKRRHFLTVGFQDDSGQQQAIVFRVEKNDIRLALVALEARTGQRVQYQDDEARVGGKG